MSEETQLVPFRVFNLPCCGFNLCWVNPRLPSYCPECGSLVFLRLKGDKTLVLVRDNQARLTYEKGC